MSTPNSIWQPIETAPYGEYVLIFCEGLDPTVARKADRESTVWLLAQTGDYAEGSGVDFEPTHWAPIPETPQ